MRYLILPAFALVWLTLVSCDPVYTVRLYSVNHTGHTLYYYRKTSENQWMIGDTLQPNQTKKNGQVTGITMTPQKYLSRYAPQAPDTEWVAIDHPDSVVLLIADDITTGAGTVYFHYRETALRRAVRCRLQTP